MSEDHRNVWSYIPDALLRSKSYIALARLPWGRVWLYLLCLMALCAPVTLLRFSFNFASGCDELARRNSDKVPFYQFKGGQFTMDAQMPYVIASSKDSLYLIDVPGQTRPETLAVYKHGFVLLKDKAVYKKNAVETDVYDYKNLGAFSFTKDDVTRWLPLLKWLLVPIWLGWGVWFLIEKFFNALVVALVGLIARTIIGAKATFAELYKMSLFALTLSFLIFAFNNGFSLRLPLSTLSYYGTGIVYLWLALQALKNQTSSAAAPAAVPPVPVPPPPSTPAV